MSYTDHKTSEVMLSRDKQRNSLLMFNFKRIFLLLSILVSITAGGQFAWATFIQNGGGIRDCKRGEAYYLRQFLTSSDWEWWCFCPPMDGVGEGIASTEAEAEAKAIEACCQKPLVANNAYTTKGDTEQSYVPTDSSYTAVASAGQPGIKISSDDEWTIAGMYSLQISTIGDGQVVSQDGYINCGSACKKDYLNNTTVTLTATPSSNFIEWSGACTGNNPTTTVKMTSAKNCTAKFVPCGTEWLNTLISKFESEPVCNPPRLIYKYDHEDQTYYYVPSCSADQYSMLYDSCGNLLCAPDGGITGKGDGKCPAFTNITELKNDEVLWTDKRIPKAALTISTPIGGTVTSNDTGINCGSDCKEEYALNTQVSLTAKPVSGYVFKNWTGESCSGATSTITVKMDAAKTCAANFVKLTPKTASFKIGRFTVTNGMSSKSGTRSGSVCLPVGCQLDKSGNHPNGYSFSVTSMNSPGGGYSNNNSVSQNKDGQWCLNSSVTIKSKSWFGGNAWYEGTHTIYGMCAQ